MSLPGFFAIGIDHTKTAYNVGSLWRSADLMGAAFMFTVGKRYRDQSSDTMKAHRHIPLFHFISVEELRHHLPMGCRLVGVELHQSATPIQHFQHPRQCAYLLGAEDNGLSPNDIKLCHMLVQLPGRSSMNVASAGAIVLYDRFAKQGLP